METEKEVHTTTRPEVLYKAKDDILSGRAEKEEKQRTIQQNKSGHKYWDDVANELEAQGITRKTMVEDLSEAGVPITADFIKHVVWFHFMVGMYGKTHTPELTTKEWTEVEKVFTLHLQEHYGLQTEYPSEEKRSFNEFYEEHGIS